MKRQAHAAVLFLLGIAVVHASTTNLYLRYVKAGLRPLLLVAGIALIVTAVATVWYELRWQRRTGPDLPGGEHHGHEHAHREPRTSWFMVLPLFALVLVAPPALGSYSADRAGTVLQEPAGFPNLPAGDPIQLGVLDYAERAVYDHGRSIGTRQVEITGFLTVDHGTFYLTRMVLNCCAADAQPVKVAFAGQVPRVRRPDAWLEITGTYTSRQTKDPINGGVIPYIKVSASKPVPAPANPYEG